MERDNPYQDEKFVQQNIPKKPSSNKANGPMKFYGKTYVPTANASPEWLHHAQKAETSGGKWKFVNIDVGALYRDNSKVSKKYSYVSHNYIAKKPHGKESVEDAPEK